MWLDSVRDFCTSWNLARAAESLTSSFSFFARTARLNRAGAAPFASGFLNILSMRSVIRKPLTMLVIEAKMATAPRTLITVE